MKDFSIKYGEEKIIDDINIRFEKNQITAIIGESGTGKTSLGLSLLGMCQGESSGQVWVDDQDILTFNQKQWQKYRWTKLSMVFQNTGTVLNPSLTLLEQLMESIHLSNPLGFSKSKDKAKGLLKKVGIGPELYKRYPSQISGGQIQKVLVAMALTNDPEVIVFDEPTSALDTNYKKEMVELIKEVSVGRTVLLITHDFSVANSIADKVFVLYGGRVMEQGPTKDILKSPAHPYTRGLLRAFPNMTTTKDLQGIRGQMKRGNKGCPFAGRCTQSIQRCFEEKPKLTCENGRCLACHRGGTVKIFSGSNMVKHYGKTAVLKSVDFHLYEGETLALVGESGSGKTTFAKLLMGLETLDEGSLEYNGQKLSPLEKSYYQQVQIVHQSPLATMNRRFTVYDIMEEPLRIHDKGNQEERKTRIKNILEEVHLPSSDRFLKRYPHELSGGEAQRLAIARALILEPKVLIADEATSALDVSVQAKIMNLFMALQEKKGLSLIFITHDIALARKVSDKMMVMKEGKIVEYGHSSLVTGQPEASYTKVLVQGGPQIF